MAEMMPPSRCCTVLRLDSETTEPTATAALSSGAITDQVPKPMTKTPINAEPASTSERVRASGLAGIGGETWSSVIRLVMNGLSFSGSLLLRFRLDLLLHRHRGA